MSIVALADGFESSIALENLQSIAAKNNFTIPSGSDEAAYLLVLQSAEATTTAVDNLPDYIDPRLLPIPVINANDNTTTSTTEEKANPITQRTYRKPSPSKNSHNAWSHLTSLKATNPTTSALKDRTIAVKDNMSVAGLPYTCGTFPQFHNAASKYMTPDSPYPISPIDATIVRRVLEAGGHIIGTSTCENYSLTPMSYSSANGPVSNPWLADHNAGGSTSGGACLLALRAARAAGVPGLDDAGEDIDIALGGDQAGSIRLPASYCGVYGLKPTHGLIPYTGIAGLHPMIDYTGPLAHNIEDIATALSVMAGYDGLDPRMTPEAPLRENVRDYAAELNDFVRTMSGKKSGSGLRIGIIKESLSSPGASEAVSTVVADAATKFFTAAGAEVTHVSVPFHLIGPMIWAASSRTQMASLAICERIPDILTHNLPHFNPRWPPDQEMFDLLNVHNPAIINIILSETMMAGKYGSDVQAKAHRHVLQLRAAYDQALQTVDVLITPTTPIVAPHLPLVSSQEEGGVMEKAKMTAGATNNTCPFNATGHPAISVPCGWAESKDGSGWLPVGMQIIGKRWDDMTVLKAAKVFELGGGGLGKWPSQRSS